METVFLCDFLKDVTKNHNKQEAKHQEDNQLWLPAVTQLFQMVLTKWKHH